MRWKIMIQKVHFQASGPAHREQLNFIDPVKDFTMTRVLNDAGRMEIGVNHYDLPSNVRNAIIDLLKLNDDGRILEVVVYSPTNKIFWSGPIVGMKRTSKTITKLIFRDDLFWFERMLLHSVRSYSSAYDQFAYAADIIQNGMAGYTSTTDPTKNLRAYNNPNITVPTARSGRQIMQHSDGVNAFDPRNGKTILDWMKFLANRDPRWRFHFQMVRELSSNSDRLHDLKFEMGRLPVGSETPDPGGTRLRDIGFDRTDLLAFWDAKVIEHIGVATSFEPKDFCNVVYAVGEGDGTSSSADGRVWYYASPLFEDNDDSSFFADTRPNIGMVCKFATAMGLTEGDPDGSDNTGSNGEDDVPSHIVNYAEGLSQSRKIPYVVPAGYTFALDDNNTIVQDPTNLKPGDVIKRNQETGFGVGFAVQARISKIVYKVFGGINKVSVEFA